jgi:phage terminase small subunit
MENSLMRGRKPATPPGGADVVALPGVVARVPDPPAKLSAGELVCWNEAAAVMVRNGTYDEDCRHLLHAYCVQYARFIEADEHAKVDGIVPKGKWKQNIWITASNNAFDRMTRLGAELGLTPMRRGKAVRAKRSAGLSGADKFLKRGP